MNIQINGKVESFVAETLTVSALLVAQKVDMPEMVSVEVTGDVLDRDAFGTTVVKEGDTVEFLYFMGGGRA